MKEKKIK